MSQYLIEIDDSVVQEQINRILNSMLNRGIQEKTSGVSYVISDAVKELIYSRKDEIVDKVVDRAVREIVKRGLPKLMERMEVQDDKR